MEGLKIFEKRVDDTFSKSGFSYWNDGLRRLLRHEESASHQEAHAAVNKSNTTQKIDEALDQQLKNSKTDNHYVLSAVIDAMKFLSKQGMTIFKKVYNIQNCLIS